MNIHQRYLTVEEMKPLISNVLQQEFAAFGYKDARVREDETFDGMQIIRVNADVERPVSAEILIATGSTLQNVLRDKREERVVFLSAPGPASDLDNNQEDEDLL